MKELIRLSEKINPVHEEIQSYGVTRSFSGKRTITPDEFRKFAAELMASITESCLKKGAKEIGHIKAHLDYESGFLSADTLGSPEDVTVEGRDGDPAKELTVVINSVIYGLTKEAVRTATEESLEAVSAEFGMVENKGNEKKEK